jgi:hypothetical protein
MFIKTKKLKVPKKKKIIIIIINGSQRFTTMSTIVAGTPKVPGCNLKATGFTATTRPSKVLAGLCRTGRSSQRPYNG